MKLLLGSLLLAGVCWLGAAVVVPIMPNFNNERIAKLWYPLLTIAIGPMPPTHVPPFRLLTGSNGNLQYNIRYPMNGRCKVEQGALNKRGQAGYYANSEVPFTIRFVDTDYYNYFIAYLTRGSGEEVTFLALASTLPTVTWALESVFREVATSMGITGEILHTVLQATC